jgi:hypothetical protein
LDEIQAEPVVASVTRFGSVGYVSKMERFEFGYVQKDKKNNKIRSFGRSKNQILNATVSGTVIITANGRRYGGAGRWIESIAAESIVEIAQDVESSEEE